MSTLIKEVKPGLFTTIDEEGNVREFGFKTEIEAAVRADQLALDLFGEFASTNFLPWLEEVPCRY